MAFFDSLGNKLIEIDINELTSAFDLYGNCSFVTGVNFYLSEDKIPTIIQRGKPITQVSIRKEEVTSKTIGIDLVKVAELADGSPVECTMQWTISRSQDYFSYCSLYVSGANNINSITATNQEISAYEPGLVDVYKLSIYGFIILDNNAPIGTAYVPVCSCLNAGIEQSFYIPTRGMSYYHNSCFGGVSDSWYQSYPPSGISNPDIDIYFTKPIEREFDNSDNTVIGGGYGTGNMPHDNIDLPVLPTVNMTDCGASLYALDSVTMRLFTKWLWTTDWIENLKKLQNNPMENIIGISLTDIPQISGTTKPIVVGNVKTTVSATAINNSFIELDCGSITLEEYYGTFADYEPFVATTLYLPKVGFVQIPADCCVNNTIQIVYHLELASGEGLCYVILTSKRDGFTYIWNTYTCHFTSNVALSAQDHSQQIVALGNAIINSSVSVAGAIASPALTPQAIANVASNCFNVATTKNPTQTRGNIGNMSSIMCYKKPYILINRTNLTKPTSFQENNGYMINYTDTISGHTGFLKTRDYHAEFNAPYNHKVEIERLMNEGVFING